MHTSRRIVVFVHTSTNGVVAVRLAGESPTRKTEKKGYPLENACRETDEMCDAVDRNAEHTSSFGLWSASHQIHESAHANIAHMESRPIRWRTDDLFAFTLSAAERAHVNEEKIRQNTSPLRLLDSISYASVFAYL